MEYIALAHRVGPGVLVVVAVADVHLAERRGVVDEVALHLVQVEGSGAGGGLVQVVLGVPHLGRDGLALVVDEALAHPAVWLQQLAPAPGEDRQVLVAGLLDDPGEGALGVLPGGAGDDVLLDQLAVGVQLLHRLAHRGVVDGPLHLVDLVEQLQRRVRATHRGLGGRQRLDPLPAVHLDQGGLVLLHRVHRGVGVRHQLLHVLAHVQGLGHRAAQDGHVHVAHEGLGQPEHRQGQGLAATSGCVPDRVVGGLAEEGVGDRVEGGHVVLADRDPGQLDVPQRLDHPPQLLVGLRSARQADHRASISATITGRPHLIPGWQLTQRISSIRSRAGHQLSPGGGLALEGQAGSAHIAQASSRTEV
jgi:hypothetical protein